MPIFEIQGQDGSIYEVDAPDENAALEAFSGFTQQSQVDRSSHPEFDPANVPGGVPGYDPATGEVTPQYSVIDSLLQGAADIGSYGYGDEIASYLGSWTSGKPREKVLDEMRTMQSQAQEQNPKSFMAGQIGGGIASGLGGLGTKAAASLGGRILQGAGAGGVAGALYGSGSGTDAASRGMGALEEGAKGAFVGGAFPVLASGAGKAYQTARNALSARPIAQQAGADPQTLRMLGDVMDADGSLGPQGIANMQRAGSEAMLADAGPNARAVLDTAIQRGGKGGLAAREAIDARVARGAQDATAALDSTLGAHQGVNASQRSIRDAARPSVNAAYERAYNTPIDYASEAGRKVENIIKRIPDRIAGRAVNDAVDRMIYDGVPNAQMMAKIADDGKVTFQAMPNVMQADYIKRALNNIVEDGTDDMTGKMSSEAVFASRMARDLRDALGDAVPAYKEALETAADPLSRQSAIRLGSKLLSPSMTRDQVAASVKNMTGPERQAVAQGVRSQIDDAMARVSRTVMDGDTDAREAVKALKELSSRANRSKLALAIGDEQAGKLFQEMDRIATSFDLRASVADNSKTFARQATNERVSDISGQGGVWSTAKQGEPLNATKRLIQALTGETNVALKGREDKVYNELARLLTRQGGAGQDVYDAVKKLGMTDAATQKASDQIIRALGGPHLAYPASVQLPDMRQGR